MEGKKDGRERQGGEEEREGNGRECGRGENIPALPPPTSNPAFSR